MDIISYVTPERTIDDEPVTYLSEQISDYGFPLRLIFRRYTIQAEAKSGCPSESISYLCGKPIVPCP